MKVCILLVLGVIACNLGAINGFRMKRQIDEFCDLPVKLRTAIWNCIESNMAFKDRKPYVDIARCFNEANFVDVMNNMCGKTDDEIEAMAALHEDCLEGLDLDESNEIDVDEEDVQNCVLNSL
ncbi:uncharacterized protein [Centruroides vittatus]|uniref:uncharacterized protein n=1 Tax=Centruroides vittatus TaxID=120091 RepID=UPI00350E923B